MDKIVLGIFIFLLLANFLSFSVMLYDKNLARTGQRRISEGTLFFLAIFFGGPGIYLGMFTFHHKTRKWYFYFGIPLIAIQNFCSLLLLYQAIKGVCFFTQFF
jgi:uncharacterized membrane protein YsdA (DUF1294 family)